MMPIIIKEKDGKLSLFEITDHNEIIMSGDNWKERRSRADKMPMYGSCKTGKFSSKKEAKEILKFLIEFVTTGNIS